jgi:hypothetical protein
VVAYALTIFTGAFLLFSVQPLIAKYILPWFGGTASVWTVCMLFFQMLLLAGYGYAHLTTRYLPARAQCGLHLAVLALALLSLPITPSEGWRPIAGDEPTQRILLLLTASIGLAYVTLATTGPLLQRWYSGLRRDAPPYRLYALSNAGSLLALLAYPFAIEPALSRTAQAELWSWGMVVFAGLCGYCAVRAMRLTEPPGRAPVGEDGERGSPPPSRRDYALWLALPTVASLMLLATTDKVTQDVAVIPFLWVLPLSLYLLSFILCFDNPRWYRRALFGVALLVSIAEYDSLTRVEQMLVVKIGAHAGILFVICMVCHGELYRLRPHPKHLTEFYLMVAAGGALGGLLVALVAPHVFAYYQEFELGIMSCALLALVVHYFDEDSPLHGGRPRLAWACLLVACLGLGYVLVENVNKKRRAVIYAKRDFYGALYLKQDRLPSSVVRNLHSGSTLHGIQIMYGELRREPTAYFAEETGVGLALRNFPRQRGLHIGLMGLGIGTLAAYAESGDRLRFYEINPRVEKLAREQFTYLADARAPVSVVLGDARLSLEREAPQEFDVLVLDAFSGDAIPAHLLTTEAFEIYLRHLRPDGLIAAHISNRHLDLKRVLVALGAHFDLTTLYLRNATGDERRWVLASEWVLMTRNPTLLASKAIAGVAQVLDHSSVRPILWTDEHTSLLQVLR